MRRTTLLLPCAIALVLSACDRGGDTSTGGGILEPAPAWYVAGGWSSATRLEGPNLNTSFLEGCPSESPDGRSLYFATNRSGNLDIYVTHRLPNGQWSEPQPLEGVNSSAADYCPSALPGGRLLFVSERAEANCTPGGGRADIYETRLDPVHGWTAPVHLGCEINSAANEFSPSWVPAGGGMLFFSSDRAVPGVHAIYVSQRGGTPEPVLELNEGGTAFRPNVSADGREIVFDSNRAGSAGSDIWYSHRATPNSSWAAPVRLQEPSINTPSNQSRPWISRDGRRLYFGSVYDGSSDLFVAYR